MWFKIRLDERDAMGMSHMESLDRPVGMYFYDSLGSVYLRSFSEKPTSRHNLLSKARPGHSTR